MAIQKRNKTVYTDGASIYDSSFSALKFTLADEKGMIFLSPVISGMSGKKPKAGEKMYDYDNKLSFQFSVTQAITLKEGIDNLLTNKGKSVSIETTFNDTKRSFTVFSPNSIQLGGKTLDNYLLRISLIDEDSTQKVYHSLKKEIYIMDKEEYEVEAGLKALIAFLDAVVENASSVAWHGAKRNGSSPSYGGGGNTRRNLDDDDDEVPVSSSRRAKVVEEEFLD